MALDCFDLHEDEWGMIDLIPEENRAHAQSVVGEAAAHGEAHLAPDGVGYTAVYVAPEPLCPLSMRALTVSGLAGLLGSRWRRVARVRSGYASHREELTGAYAFTDGLHMLYGSHSDGLLTTLHLRPGDWDDALIDTLHALGQGLRLILLDLWRDRVVELSSHEDTAAYARDL